MDSRSIRLYKGMLEILSIATIMTIFELPFYIYIVKPNINLAIESLINSQSQETRDEPFYDRFDHVLEVFKYREYAYIYDIDIGSYLLIVVEICLLLTIVRHIVTRILHFNNDTAFKNSIRIVFFVISILISFQIFFFFFARNFHYIGLYGEDEIITRFVEKYKEL